MIWKTGLVALAAWAVQPALALPMPVNELERNCWQRYTRERTRLNLREPTLVDFSNLASGYQLRAPFMVEFAVRGMGVVPAGNAMPGTGHHHVLIDAPLPRNIGEKIPFSDTHKHFGKGQTFGVLDLPPGEHTLRLLFADHDHKPHFVYSPQISIKVTGRRTAQPLAIDPAHFDETCAQWYQDEQSRPRPAGEWLAVANVRDGEAVFSPMTLRFSVEGWGVSAAKVNVDRTGHFLLEVWREGRQVLATDLSNGATQTTLALANGTHRLRLRFVDAGSSKDLLPVLEQALVVVGQDR